MKCTPHSASHLHYLQIGGPEAFSGCQSAQHRDLSESNEPLRPHYFLCCQEGSPGPSQPQDPFSESAGEKGVSSERGGHPGPSYATASVPSRDRISSAPQANDPCPASYGRQQIGL
ncbi:hypothetical protein WMY93_018745 [Mugilogobius chulae]|uniref:Uncharacterized protein n=1 Tax=Mugilogobius chulae TaxID=88201 RepID=A0AAW0NRP4_9GOBI